MTDDATRTAVRAVSAARGDTKPCTVAGCPGRMQYDRRRSAAAAPSSALAAVGWSDANGWNCDADHAHFSH